jgi:hypothetical protein
LTADDGTTGYGPLERIDIIAHELKAQIACFKIPNRILANARNGRIFWVSGRAFFSAIAEITQAGLVGHQNFDGFGFGTSKNGGFGYG